MQLDEISWGEGRVGGKSPGPALLPALGSGARKGTCGDTGTQCPKPGGAFQERGTIHVPAAGGDSAGDHGETTSVFANVVTSGVTDHQHVVSHSTACSRRVGRRER